MREERTEIRDERERLINEICMKLSVPGMDIQEMKNSLYMIMNGYEITTRSTEVAILKEDRNEALLKQFIVAKKVKGCTEKTLKAYWDSNSRAMKQMSKTVDDITTSDIRYYMAIRLRRDKVATVTVGNEVRNLSSFFTWLHAEGLIRHNPMARIDRVKVPKTKKEAFTEMEIEKLRNAADGEREQAIIELLFSTGCRVSELVQITKTDIEGDRVLVHGKGQKDRYVYLTARAQLALARYMGMRKDDNPYIFAGGIPVEEIVKNGTSQKDYKQWWMNPENVTEKHLGTGVVERMTRKLAKRAGVERANPHKFRRTCATMALRRGMPIEQVSRMLGHEEIATTQIYLDLSEEDLKQAHKKYVM